MKTRRIIAEVLCAALLIPNTVAEASPANNLLAYEPITSEELEIGLLYDLKPLADTYVEAGETYGINPVFLAAKDAEESGWGRYHSGENNLGGWRSDDGSYMSFDSMEDYIFYSAEKLKQNYLEEDGAYYNGTSLSAVSICYSEDSETWENHIEDIMYQIEWRIEEGAKSE